MKLRGWSSLSAASEVSTRLLSLLVGGLACGYLFSLTKRWFSKETGFLAVLLFVSLDGVNTALTSARPYALGLLCCLAFIYWSDRYLEEKSKASLYAASMSLTLTWYTHYLFLGVVLVPLTSLLCGYARIEKEQVRRLVLPVFGTLLLCIPGLFHFWSVASRRDVLTFAPLPNVSMLGTRLIPLYFLLYLVSAVLMALIFGLGRNLTLKKENQRNVLKTLFVWWLFPPLLFALLSHLSGSSVFLERLFLWHKPALVILTAALLMSISPYQARRAALAIVIAFLLFRETFRKRNFEEWQHACTIVQEENEPVLLYSGLIESDILSWHQTQPERAYLSAPFTYYGCKADHLLPASPHSIKNQKFLSESLESFLHKTSKFIFVSYRFKRSHGNGDAYYVDEYYLDYFRQRSFTETVLFQRTTSPVVVYQMEQHSSGEAHNSDEN